MRMRQNNDRRDLMRVRLLQYKKHLGAGAGGNAEGAEPIIADNAISIAKDRELQDLADPMLAADKNEVFIRRAIDRHRDARAQAQPRAGGGTMKSYIELKIARPDGDRAGQPP